MPDFWQFPTVSMGLGPINAIYQARFMRYLENRGLIEATPRKIWAFLGDGETDEPESIGALRIAANEKLDNLIFVVNCNLQRLDGPVRGNGKVIQELEAAFCRRRLERNQSDLGRRLGFAAGARPTGLLIKRMNECVDGDYQTFVAKGGAYIRKEFFGKYPELLELVADLSDERAREACAAAATIRRRSTTPTSAPWSTRAAPPSSWPRPSKATDWARPAKAATSPTSRRKLNEQEMEYFCRRFEIPITDERIHTISFYRPPEDSAGDAVSAASAATSWAATCRRAIRASLSCTAPPLDYFKETLGRFAGPRSVHHDGVRPRADAAAPPSGDRQVRGSDHSG